MRGRSWVKAVEIADARGKVEQVACRILASSRFVHEDGDMVVVFKVSDPRAGNLALVEKTDLGGWTEEAESEIDRIFGGEA